MNVYKTESIGDLLSGNSYPGRGIIVGESEDAKYAVAAYFIMGRSENSRNRIFRESGEDVFTEPYDVSKVEDPSLIIYSAIKKTDNKLIVTNGDQTDTVYKFLKEGKTCRAALRTRDFEPDSPNFTPRISALLEFDKEKFNYEMSILKSGDEKGSVCNRYFYEYTPVAGLGHFIHTYITDGTPIPTFCGEPERVHIPSDIDDFTDEIWETLDSNNKISLYVRYVNLSNGEVVNRMINKNN